MFSKKSFVAGLIAGCVIAGGSAVYASSSVQAYLMNVHFLFNGTEKQLPSGYVALNYQGRTYVPARFVAEQLGATVGWDNSTSSVTIDTPNTSGGTSTSTSVKSFPVSIDITSGPMTMHISKVTLDPSYKNDQYASPINAIVLAVTVQNSSDQTVEWDPEQGTLVTNTEEQADAGMSMMYSDQVGGEFDGKIIKSGNIAVQVKSDLSKITSISFKIGGAFDPNNLESKLGEDTTTPINLQS